ncbi:MAG TPA: pirin family protein [Methylomirabilota bacterium]|nr:pirin family protein [Methylomirabilota bacterium]
MLKIRKAKERGHADHGWLDTYHTFSFADYWDPRHMGWGPLRVINEDRVAGGTGFPTHAHRDMEIITYVLEGALEHRDSLGTGSVIRPGEVQRMSAGTGVRHSEYNASKTDAVHLLQIWIEPARAGIAPGYEQKTFPESERRGRLRLIAAADGRDGAVTIHQDAAVYATVLARGERVEHTLAPKRLGWLQVARGAVLLNGERLDQGDGAAIENERRVTLEALEPAEALLFDLPA